MQVCLLHVVIRSHITTHHRLDSGKPGRSWLKVKLLPIETCTGMPAACAQIVPTSPHMPACGTAQHSTAPKLHHAEPSDAGTTKITVSAVTHIIDRANADWPSET